MAEAAEAAAAAAAATAHLCVWKGHQDSVNCLDASSDGRLVASGSDDSSTRVWDPRTGECAHVIDGVYGGEPVNSVSFSPKHPHMLYTAAGSSIRGFDLRVVADAEARIQPCHEYDCNSEEINQLAVHPKKGNFLAACDDDGEIQLIDLEARKPIHRLRNRHENLCTTVVRNIMLGALYNNTPCYALHCRLFVQM